MIWNPTLEGKPAQAIDRQVILDFLDTLPEVYNWRANLRAIFIVSDASHELLSEKIHTRFPGLLHIVALISGETCQGWVDQDTWDFIEKLGDV
jgi:hypothetical protein